MSWQDELDRQKGFIKNDSITLEVVDHSVTVLFKLTLLVFFHFSRKRRQNFCLELPIFWKTVVRGRLLDYLSFLKDPVMLLFSLHKFCSETLCFTH